MATRSRSGDVLNTVRDAPACQTGVEIGPHRRVVKHVTLQNANSIAVLEEPDRKPAHPVEIAIVSSLVVCAIVFVLVYELHNAEAHDALGICAIRKELGKTQGGRLNAKSGKTASFARSKPCCLSRSLDCLSRKPR